MIKLLIFDLDNTLFDTRGQLGFKALNIMIEKMKKLGLSAEQEAILREKYHFTGFRILARQLGLSEEMQSIGIETYKAMDLSKITPYDDVKLLKAMKQKKVLVTSGTKEVQLKKIEVLKIGNYFDEIIVDESNILENKKEIFSKLLARSKLKPKEVMVIGDNPESEVAAGNKLGMVVMQILREAYAKGKADYYIKGLDELGSILKEVAK